MLVTLGWLKFFNNTFKQDILFKGLNDHAVFQGTIIAQVISNEM
jgi:hypothetical protein